MKNLSELLLLSNNRVEGPRRVTATVRPLRVAYLVDPSNPPLALAAIECACLSWGGMFQFLIPCGPGAEPRPPWDRVLDRYDPDYIVDLVGVSKEYLARQWSEFGRRGQRWERPTETMRWPGAFVYGALHHWSQSKRPDHQVTTLHLTPLAGHALALPLAFRWGHLDRRTMEGGEKSPFQYPPAQHADFVTLHEFDPFGLPEKRLIRLVAEAAVSPDVSDLIIGQSQAPNNWDLPRLTRLALRAREPAHYGGEAPLLPEYEQHDEAYLRRVIVVGPPDRVEDLCLAWNLRGQRTLTWRIPVLWVAPEWLEDPDVLRSIDMALQEGRGGLVESSRDVKPLHLISASLTSDELAKVARQCSWPTVVHDRSSLDHFVTNAFKVGETETSVVAFHNGIADIPIPDHSNLGDFSTWESIGWTISIDGYRVPPGSNNFFFRGGVASRIASDGVAGFISGDDVGRLEQIGTNNGWEIVRGVAERAGYEAELSDKGRLATGVANLLGDQRGLAVLASSRVYELLRKMADIVPYQAVQQHLSRSLGRSPLAGELQDTVESLQRDEMVGGQFDRQHYPYDGLLHALGMSSRAERQAGEAVIRWLVGRRILFRGYVTTCPNCGLKRWYPVDRLSERHFCDGCQEESYPSPIGTGQLRWHYRLNELIARAVDQGVLPHLLVANELSEWSSLRESDFLGFLAGLLFRPKTSGEGTHIEVDFFGIYKGHVLIGECKASGDHLTEGEVHRLANLARRLNCSRIIYATPTDFSAVPDAIRKAKEASAPMMIQVLEGKDLLDRTWADRFVGSRSPGSSPVEYLQWIAKVVTAP